MQVAKKRSRVAFSTEEDCVLKRLVEIHGQNWDLIARLIGNRNARQCKDRYMNYLRPDLAQHEWTEEEDALLIRLVEIYGKKWTQIAKEFGNRSEPMVKVRWKYVKKREKTTEPCVPVNDLAEEEMDFIWEYLNAIPCQ